MQLAKNFQLKLCLIFIFHLQTRHTGCWCIRPTWGRVHVRCHFCTIHSKWWSAGDGDSRWYHTLVEHKAEGATSCSEFEVSKRKVKVAAVLSKIHSTNLLKCVCLIFYLPGLLPFICQLAANGCMLARKKETYMWSTLKALLLVVILLIGIKQLKCKRWKTAKKNQLLKPCLRFFSVLCSVRASHPGAVIALCDNPLDANKVSVFS